MQAHGQARKKAALEKHKRHRSEIQLLRESAQAMVEVEERRLKDTSAKYAIRL